MASPASTARDIAPDDSYFVVTSGSGGDAPPISDTAVAYPLNATSLQNSDVQPLWISRHFDSIYSVAITEQAVYVGGHFGFIESPTCPTTRGPGLDNVGYGTGQGLAGYGLGDQVVRRDHIAAISRPPARRSSGTRSRTPSRATRPWRPPRAACSSAATACSRAVSAPGGSAFYDFNTVTFPAALPDTTITAPIEGRVVENNTPFTITGTARVTTGTVGRVQVQIQDRDSSQYLQDNGTAFTTTFSGTANTLNATLAPAPARPATGRCPGRPSPPTATCVVYAQAFTAATGGTGDSTKADEVVRVVQHRGPDADDQRSPVRAASRPRPRSR